jgi:hypothetical protein
VAEGVFAEQRDGSQRFVPLREPPSDVEVARLLAAIDRVRGRARVRGPSSQRVRIGRTVVPMLTRLAQSLR